MSEGMRQGQKEHLGPRGVSVDSTGEPWKTKICLHLLSWDPPPTNTSVTARLIPLSKAPPEA